MKQRGALMIFQGLFKNRYRTLTGGLRDAHGTFTALTDAHNDVQGRPTGSMQNGTEQNTRKQTKVRGSGADRSN